MPGSAEPQPRVEQKFHEEMWDLANNSMRLERAAGDARDLCYAVLAHFDGDGDSTVAWIARQWVDNFGRDERQEDRIRQIREERAAES